MLPELTDRENQILNLIAGRPSNGEISCTLSIGESTLENHFHHIYEKPGISNRVQAASHAFFLRVWLPNEVTEYRGNPSSRAQQ